jgi:hypothetical protein
MELEQLKLEESKLIRALESNRKLQREIQTDILLTSLGIKFGDLLEVSDQNKPVIGELFKVEYSGTKPDYLFIKLLNTNGEIGKRERRVWGHEMKTLKLHKTDEITN